jgi:hypothetical protein
MSGWLLAGVLQYRAVAVATQRDLSDRFARAGFEVRSVKIQELVTVGQLQEVVERRLQWARRGPGPIPGIGRDTLAGLFRRYGPDLRAIQSDLYDHFQKLEAEA